VELFPLRGLSYPGRVKGQVDDLVASIRARSPSWLLVDDPATLSRHDPHRVYFERLEAGLANRYRLDGIRSGWSVWKQEPRPSP